MIEQHSYCLDGSSKNQAGHLCCETATNQKEIIMNAKHIPRFDGRAPIASMAQKRQEAEQLQREVAAAIKAGVKVQVIPFGESNLPDNIQMKNGIRP